MRRRNGTTKRKGLNTIDAMKTTIRAGKWVHQAPVRYVNSSAPGGLTQDPIRAPLINLAFTLFATGEYTKAAVLSNITAQGLTMPRTGKPLSPQTLDKTLKKPFVRRMDYELVGHYGYWTIYSNHQR